MNDRQSGAHMEFVQLSVLAPRRAEFLEVPKNLQNEFQTFCFIVPAARDDGWFATGTRVFASSRLHKR
jgi:hypothetical protein